jgi:hypothetical protein
VRRLRVIVLSAALAGAILACATFGSNGTVSPVDDSGAEAAAADGPAPGDGGNDAEANAADAPCWPTGACPSTDVCCVARDLSSSCGLLNECTRTHSWFACRVPSDCAPGTTCCLSPEVPDEAGTQFVHTACVPGGCHTSADVVCASQADCEGGTVCNPPLSTFIPSDHYTICF